MREGLLWPLLIFLNALIYIFHKKYLKNRVDVHVFVELEVQSVHTCTT